MRVPELPRTIISASGGEPTPFSQAFVMLSKQEHIRLVADANYWRMAHQQAAERALRTKAWYEHKLQQATSLAEHREAELRRELQTAQAKIRDLEQRLFGRKSERRWLIDDRHRQRCAPRRPRGQQPGAPGHGRRCLEHLPVRSEMVEIESPYCPACGLPLIAFPGTDDCDVLEVEVQAYRRLIRRRRYRRNCQCEDIPGIVTAPAPLRLIERGKLGVSVWVHILLDKFLYGRPSFRLLQDLADQGLALSLGTVTGGLRVIAPLFEPLKQALADQLRAEAHWHADETRWEVFVELEGKIGHRWYLWVFQSQSVAYYVLDESRSASVPAAVLAGVNTGTISCDRYAAYKKFARQHPGFVLAFCWSHQRRDLLNLANDYPELAAWAMAWVECIGDLFALHAQRREAAPASERYCELDRRVRSTLEEMAQKRTAALADPSLPAAAARVLESMHKHWQGLTVFVNQPQLPLDNNAAERALRPAVVGRKNYYGSGSQWSGKLAATLFSVLMTVKQWGINPRTWLAAYLQACAGHGNRAPSDLGPFLPWTMDALQLAAMRASPSG